MFNSRLSPILLALTFSVVPSVAVAQSIGLSERFSTAFNSQNPPEGIDVKDFKLRASLKSGIGYDDNVFRTQTNRRHSLFNNTSIFASASSNWEKHQSQLSFFGDGRFFFKTPEANNLFGRAATYNRLDLPKNTKLELVGSYTYDEEARDDRRIVSNFSKSVLDQIFQGDAYLVKGFDKLAVTVRGGVKREINEDAITNDGFAVERSDADYTRFISSLRISYALQDKRSVFAEVGVNDWRFDSRVDRNAIVRGGEGLHAVVGGYFEAFEKLKGEAAIGVRQQRFPDRQFNALTAFTFDGWLNWAATEKTQVTLTAKTRFEEEDVFGRAGTLSRSISLALGHYMTEKTRLFAKAGYSFEDNINNPTDDHFVYGQIGIDHEIAKGVLLTGSYRYRKFNDGDNFSGYHSNEIIIGLKTSL